MNDTERFNTIQAMRRYGGGFVQLLAAAWEHADEKNSQRIEAAFPEYMRDYGPDSQFQKQRFA